MSLHTTPLYGLCGYPVGHKQWYEEISPSNNNNSTQRSICLSLSSLRVCLCHSWKWGPGGCCAATAAAVQQQHRTSQRDHWSIISVLGAAAASERKGTWVKAKEDKSRHVERHWKKGSRRTRRRIRRSCMWLTGLVVLFPLSLSHSDSLSHTNSTHTQFSLSLSCL